MNKRDYGKQHHSNEGKKSGARFYLNSVGKRIFSVFFPPQTGLFSFWTCGAGACAHLFLRILLVRRRGHHNLWVDRRTRFQPFTTPAVIASHHRSTKDARAAQLHANRRCHQWLRCGVRGAHRRLPRACAVLGRAAPRGERTREGRRDGEVQCRHTS